jgi:hypothetical protein
MRALKSLKYQTRRLMAGDHFEVKTARKARILAAIGKAEAIPHLPAQKPGDHRVGVEGECGPAGLYDYPGGGSDLESMTVSQLRRVAEERGIELPPGYVTRATLLEILEGHPN